MRSIDAKSTTIRSNTFAETTSTQLGRREAQDQETKQLTTIHSNTVADDENDESVKMGTEGGNVTMFRIMFRGRFEAVSF